MSRRPPPDSDGALEPAAKRQRHEEQPAAAAATDPEQPGVEQAAAEVAAEDVAAGSPVVHLSAAQRCHADALQLIFSFVRLNGVPVAMRSCRSWRTAAGKELPRGLQVTVGSVAMQTLPESPLRRHVAKLNTGQGVSQLRVAQLRRLRFLPKLTSLVTSIDDIDMNDELEAAGNTRQQDEELMREVLPIHLHTLDFSFTSAGSAGLICQALVDALPVVTKLATLSLRNFGDHQTDLSPLLQLSQLRHLTLETRPTPQQCAVLKQLPLLELEVVEFSHAAVMELLAQPHQLQLEKIDIRHLSLTPPLMALLAGMPTLTELQPLSVHPECWTKLRVLKKLRTLEVKWSLFQASQAQLADLGASLKALKELSAVDVNLTRLGPRGVEVAVGLLEVLDLSRPKLKLRSLTLKGVSVPSLNFLKHSKEIEVLRLRSRGPLTPDTVVAFLLDNPPQLLRELHLPVALHSDQEHALFPPSSCSVLLPALNRKQFSSV